MKGVRVRVTTAKGTPVSADWHLQMPIGIGRSSRCAVRLHGWRIASQHAAIEREDDGLHLKVLDGDVRVNGCVSRGYGPLSPDDIIEIHDYRLDVAAATAIALDRARRQGFERRLFTDLDADGVADVYHRVRPDGTFETWRFGDGRWRLLDRGDIA